MAKKPTAVAPMAAPTRAAPMSAEEVCEFAGVVMSVIVEWLRMAIAQNKVKSEAYLH
jgi:hypothetical protein